MSELARTLAVLAEPPGPSTERIATLAGLPGKPEGWRYHEIFLQQLYPYASVYLGHDGKIGGDAQDRIAGFWRVFGESPPADPDHLSTLLGAYANLVDAGHAAAAEDLPAWDHARGAFLFEHLLSWVPLWLAKVEEIADEFYRGWAVMLGEWLEREAARTALPDGEPAHFRDAGRLEAPEDDGEAFIAALLTPLRSGFIVTRHDLGHLAGRAGLALRAGERSYALKALLAQDPAATLSGLSELAAAGARPSDRIGAFWQEQARASAALLRALAADVVA